MDGLRAEILHAPLAPPQAGFRVSVVLPAFNEERAIVGVLREITEALVELNFQYEIIVVDDASTDRTAELAEQFATDCWMCPVHVLRSTERRGAGGARKQGIRAAQGEIVVMLDADGTYPAASINRLLEHFPEYDQVNGARTCEAGSWPWLRGPVKWVIRRLACRLSGREIPDLNTGLKAFKREAMLPWLWIVPDGFSCVTTMTLTFLTNGYAVKYVPTEYRPRIGSSKFHPLRDTYRYVLTVLRMALYFRPMKIFLPLAIVFAASGLARMLFDWQQGACAGEASLMLLGCSAMTFVAGLLAEVVAAHRPRV